METVQCESINPSDEHAATDQPEKNVEEEEEDEGPVELQEVKNDDIAECDIENDVNMIVFENSSQLNGSHNSNNCTNDGENDENDENNFLVRLVFRDNSAFDELHQIIGKCIRDALFLLKKPTDIIVDKSENCVKINEISADNDDSMFMVDTLPMENANKAEIPDYNSSALDVLNEEEADSNEIEGENNKPKMGNCWNCGGDHNMRDCKEKRDPNAIIRAKQSFIQKTRTERYHLDNDQKYSHLLPGQITNSLREALGLRPRELPMYVYKMRLFGYPVGWLEEAKINHSGLSFIHSEVTNHKLASFRGRIVQ